MDLHASPSPAPSGPASSDLQRDLNALRLAFSLTLVALVVLSGSLAVYLFRQDVLLRRQVESASRVSAQAYQHYKDQIEPQAVAFERQLMEFARSNADFQLQISKYFPNGFGGSPSSATTTAQGNAAAKPAPKP